MMKTNLLIILFFIHRCIGAQDTFSIAAVDSSSREVGSAGASCVDLFLAGFEDGTFLGDLIPDTGAINTQASYLPANQVNARIRMRAGDTPTEIINWLAKHDVGANATVRQYGIASFSGMNAVAAGFTGENCINYKNHRTGSIDGMAYSIQGNILIGQSVIDSMEAGFRRTEGDLACRLMAALQGAKVVGADTRCTPDGTSSLFAFIKVSQPDDSYGFPSLRIAVRTHDNTGIEPIDSLQSLFDVQHSCGTVGLAEKTGEGSFKLYPNPAEDAVVLSTNPSLAGTTYIIADSNGRQVLTGQVVSESLEIDIHHLPAGIYFIEIDHRYKVRFVKN